jgi:uncharacterized protein YbaA (DUF1428 family)
MMKGGGAMAKYVDGFVLVVPNDKNEEYKKMAEQGRDIWMRLGALEYYECRGNDLAPQDMGGGKARAFPEMAGANNDETVWFSFIVFKSKEHRDEVNAKMIEEMGKQAEGEKEMLMPFEMKRMAYGGFQVEVEGSATLNK